MLRKLSEKDVTITLAAYPETDITPGDSFDDEETVRDIESRQEHDLWAWCRVEVTCEFMGLSETVHMGGCSYASEEEFREDGYFTDLVCDAVFGLNRKIKALFSALEVQAA